MHGSGIVQAVCICIGISIEVCINVACINITRTNKRHRRLYKYDKGSENRNAPIDTKDWV